MIYKIYTIYLIGLLLFLSSTISANISAEYTVIYHTEYQDYVWNDSKYSNYKKIYSIDNHAYLKLYDNSGFATTYDCTQFDKMNYNNYFVERTQYITSAKLNYTYFSVERLRTDPTMYHEIFWGSAEADFMVQGKISFIPGCHTLGRCRFKEGKIYYTVYSYLTIRPKALETIVTEDPFLFYNTPVCIQATKGFPKEVYKWRYAYKNKKGKEVRGLLEPKRMVDNGATIYIDASEFMSEETFNYLVESQNTISISPDGAEGYYEPLAVTPVHLTAVPTAPTIESVHVTQPMCNGELAKEVIINLSRKLLDKEKVIITITAGANQHIDSITSSHEEKLVFTNIEGGEWTAQITGKYKDKDGIYLMSHTESQNHSIPFAIKEPPLVNLQASINAPILCYGDTTGSISYSITGGSGGYSCYLSNPFNNHTSIAANSGTFTQLAAGDYRLYAVDSNGCESMTQTIKIEQPDSLHLQLATTNVTIHGKNNGTLQAIFTGGMAPYTLVWQSESLNANTSSDNMGLLSNWLTLSDSMVAGNDTVFITDKNGCKTHKTYTIKQPKPLRANFRQVDSIKCYADNTASLAVDSIQGGIQPYMVEWRNNVSVLSYNEKIENLSAGNYTATITDSAGAVLTYSTTIKEPKQLYIQVESKPVSCKGDSTGTIHLTAKGGIPTYSYALNKVPSTDGYFTKLAADTYVISVSDHNGCQTDSIISINTLSTLATQIEGKAPSCYDIADGSIDLSVENGVEPYNVTWYKEDNVIAKDSYSLNYLQAGTYTMVIEDAIGCAEQISITLPKPNPFTLELTENVYLCNKQTYPISIEDPRVNNVSWYLAGQLYSHDNHQILSKEGKYDIDITYDDVCHKHSVIIVDTINQKVEASFLVSADIPVHDDAHLINVSSSNSFDSVEWIYPQNEAWVYGENNHSIQLVFLTEGTWQVGMKAYKDKCSATQYKTIHTYNANQSSSQENTVYSITELNVDKSPNKGSFTAHVELSAKATIDLYLYNAATGHIVDYKKATNNDVYDIPFSVSTKAGEYVLLLVAPDWQKSRWIKIIIH